jgi:hypothetical protein
MYNKSESHNLKISIEYYIFNLGFEVGLCTSTRGSLGTH